MNEQLQTALVDILTKVTTGVEHSITFLSTELPDVVNQLLMWKMFESLLFCILGVVLLIIVMIADLKLHKIAVNHVEKHPYSEALVLGWGMFGSVIRIFAYGFPLSILNLAWLKIWIAPKIFLIEYAATLVK